MNPDPGVNQAQRRARRYWYDDGFTEIATGSLFILVGLFFFTEAFAPPGSLPASFSAIGLPLVLIVGTLLASPVVAAVKERVTYLRTGYVSYPRSKASSRIITAVLAAAIAALLVGLFRSWTASLALVPMLQGVVIGMFLLLLANKIGLFRFQVLAVVASIAGTAAFLVGVSETLGSTAYFAAMGVAFIVSGLLTLRSYMNQTQPLVKDLAWTTIFAA